MVGVVCPSRYEFDALDRDALEKLGAGVVLSGMGKVRAAVGCARLHREHPALRRLLLVGFAGGLKGVHKGDVVEPDVFIEQDYFCEPFERFPNRIDREGTRLLGDSVDALMLTQDRFLTDNPYEDGPYASHHARIVCDMESYAVAEYARSNGIDFSAVKIVSDSANTSADHDFLTACRQLSPKLNASVLDAVRLLRG